MKHLGEFIIESDINVDFSELNEFIKSLKIKSLDFYDCNSIWEYYNGEKSTSPIIDIDSRGRVHYTSGITQSKIDNFIACLKDVVAEGVYSVEFTFNGEKFKKLCFPKPNNDGYKKITFKQNGDVRNLKPVDVKAKKFLPYLNVITGLESTDDPRLVVKSVKKI